MITNATEYERAEEELRDLEGRLELLQQSNPIGSKGFTKAGIRKLIARIHEELAVYEGSEEARDRNSVNRLLVIHSLHVGILPSKMVGCDEFHESHHLAEQGDRNQGDGPKGSGVTRKTRHTLQVTRPALPRNNAVA